jgi:hypothetical protein
MQNAKANQQQRTTDNGPLTVDNPQSKSAIRNPQSAIWKIRNPKSTIDLIRNPQSEIHEGLFTSLPTYNTCQP